MDEFTLAEVNETVQSGCEKAALSLRTLCTVKKSSTKTLKFC
jgi:hypothetical protein